MKSFIRTGLIVSALAVITTPALAQQAAPVRAQAVPPPATAPQGISGLRNRMAVISSDGIMVAETAHIFRPDYTAEDSFFTSDVGVFMERRIRGREAYVEGDTVRLRMTAAEFRARQQNPPGTDNGERR